MKKEPPKNERLITRKEQETINEIFSAPWKESGLEFPSFSHRLDRDEFPLEMGFLRYFVKGGYQLCVYPQFSTDEVLQITRLNKPKFKQWINREQIILHTAKKVGSGKQMQYSITDLLIIFLGMALLNIRAPLNLANESDIRSLVLTRLEEIVERNCRPGICRIQLNFKPFLDCWRATYSISEESPDDDDINDSAFIVINVDRLIYKTLSDIANFVGEKEMDQSPILSEFYSGKTGHELTDAVINEIESSPYLGATQFSQTEMEEKKFKLISSAPKK